MIEPSKEDIDKRERSFRALEEQYRGYNVIGQQSFLRSLAEAYEYQVALVKWYKQELKDLMKEVERIGKQLEEKDVHTS